MIKKKLANKYIYIILILIILSAFLGILDYRLGFNNVFSLLNEIILIIFFAHVVIKFFKSKTYVFKKIKYVQSFLIFTIAYLIIISLMSSVIKSNLQLSILAIKNLVFPFMLLLSGLFILNDISEFNINKLIKIVNFFALINIIMVFIGYLFGWEKVTQIVLGQSSYAFHLYSFGHSSTMLRVPGLFIDALTQGSFSYLVLTSNIILFFDNKKDLRKKLLNRNLFFSVIGAIGVIVSTNRQIIIGTIIFFIVIMIIKYKRLIISFIMWSSSIGIVTLLFILNSNKAIFSLESFKMRINIWKDIIKNMDIEKNPLRVLIGKGVDSTTLGKVDGSIELVDNSYLMLFHDYGFIGIVLFLLVLLSILLVLYKYYINDSMIKISFGYCIFFSVRMFFHSSIINEYDSYMFFIITLLGLSRVLRLEKEVMQLEEILD